MRKIKGAVVADAMESSGFEDHRARLRFQNLFQDYEDLYKETEANRSRLEILRQKKKTLLAEVRFLRQRYKYLTQTQARAQAQNPSAVRNYVKTQKAAKGGKNFRKDKNSNGNGAPALRPPVPRFDLNQKGKIHREREAIFGNETPSSEVMSKKHRTYNGKGTSLRNSSMIPDLNQKERKEASAPKVTPIFDLNLISGEEEELQENGGVIRIEEPKISLIRGGGVNDEQHNDIKLSVCRNIGNGSSQAGKRKISWQDQVALRV